LPAVADYFSANIILLYFVYGLSFFTAGLALAWQSLSPIRLSGMGGLWLLAAFGLARGIVQWLEMGVEISTRISGIESPVNMRILEFSISAVSFTFLLQFGVGMMTARRRLSPWSRVVPALLLLILAAFLAVFAHLVGGLAQPAWNETAQALVRYTIALPGSLLAAWALWEMGHSWRGAEASRMAFPLAGAAVSFVLYGIFTGLIVPPASFFPASVINTDSFLKTFGVPTQAGRALTALGIAYFLVRAYVVEAARSARTANDLLLSLNESSRAIVSKLDLGETLDLIVSQARTLLSTDTSFLSLMTEDEETLQMAASSGVRTEALKTLRLNLDQGLAGAAIREGGPFVVDDYFTATHLEGRVPDVVHAEGIISGIAAPMLKDHKPLGVLYVFNRRPTKFGPNDVAILAALASQAAIAIEHASLYQMEKERVKRLEEVDELKNEFISIASHEFRMPLTVIRRWAEYLRSQPVETLETEQSERALDSIYREASRLSALVEKVLNVSRIEAGALPYRPRRMQLSSTIETVVRGMTVEAEQRRISIETQTDQTLEVQADPDLVEQIVVNLLSNAIEHVGDNCNVWVEARVQDGMALVSVRDNGPGISPEQLPRLFGRFVRILRTEGPRPLGAGLGLYITKRLVEMHGGSIWVESTVGKGSTFFFTLPLVGVPAEQSDPSPVEHASAD